MSTLFILPDTITANIVKVTDSCSHCVQEAETNLQDVAIVGIICFVVTLCIGIISFTFYKWQSAKYNYLNKTDHRKYSLENTKTTYNTNNPDDGETMQKETPDEQLRYKAISELSGICKTAIEKNMFEDMGVYTNIIDKIYSIYQEGIRVKKTETSSTEE